MSRLLQTIRGAESEATRLEETVARLQADVIAKQAELDDLEARAGDEVVADESGEAAVRLADEAHKLRSLIDVTRRGVLAAEKGLLVARADVLRAQAAEVRDRAAKKHAGADAQLSKVDGLLSQLRDVEGVDFAWVGPPEGQIAPGQSVSYTIPLSQALRLEAQTLDDEARTLEARAADVEQGLDRPLSTYAAPPTILAGQFVS